MGLEFGGVGLGVGKTFGATYVGKELIKRGERVFFIPFLEVISLFQKEEEDRRDLERTLKETTVIVLDEVLGSSSSAQGQLFSSKFEELIRHRTNHNLVTIITTNLTAETLDELYPRTYSLLAAKQLRIDMTGIDRRRADIAWENLELLANKEVRPIT
jgi:DNA replication protein DnaC